MDSSAAKRHAYYVAHRAEAKANAAAWRAANPKAWRANQAAWRAANPEKAKANAAAWRAANPEKVRASTARRHAAWYAVNTEKQKAYGAAYRAAHRDQIAAYGAAWGAANAEKVTAFSAARRARKLGAPGVATVADIAARWTYFGDKCWLCGGIATATDHVKPLVKGGSNWPANLRPACGPCNSSKGATWPLMAVQPIGGPLALDT